MSMSESQILKFCNVTINFLFSDLINNCLPILSSILDRGSRGWYVQYRLKMMQDLQGIENSSYYFNMFLFCLVSFLL